MWASSRVEPAPTGELRTHIPCGRWGADVGLIAGRTRSHNVPSDAYPLWERVLPAMAPDLTVSIFRHCSVRARTKKPPA